MLYPLPGQQFPKAVNLDRINAIAVYPRTGVSPPKAVIYINVHGMQSPVEIQFETETQAHLFYANVLAASLT